jgi:hypothetical protein
MTPAISAICRATSAALPTSVWTRMYACTIASSWGQRTFAVQNCHGTAMVQTCFTLVGSFSGYLWCSAVRVRLHERMHVHSHRGPRFAPCDHDHRRFAFREGSVLHIY